MKQNKNQLEAEIVALLNKEYQLLLKSDFYQISSILSEKEHLVEKLETFGTSKVDIDLQKVKTLAARNTDLLSASLEGVKAAIETISNVRTSFGQLKTYDIQGQISTTATTAPRVSIKS